MLPFKTTYRSQTACALGSLKCSCAPSAAMKEAFLFKVQCIPECSLGDDDADLCINHSSSEVQYDLTKA